MSHDVIALLGLAITLLGTLIVSTWRFSSLASKLTMTVASIEKKESEQDTKLSRLEQIPAIEQRLAHVEKNYSMIPKLLGDIEVLKAQAQHSKEWRSTLLRRSRPDEEG